MLNVMSVETAAESETVAHFLDETCKIDAFLNLGSRIIAVCSRVHLVTVGNKPYDTFTVNFGIGPKSTNSQYSVLRSALASPDAVRPYWALEVYVNDAKTELLSFAFVPTKTLIEHISANVEADGDTWKPKDTNMVWISDNTNFFSVRWDALEQSVVNRWPKPPAPGAG
jgi:hypothetical protein